MAASVTRRPVGDAVNGRARAKARMRLASSGPWQVATDPAHSPGPGDRRGWVSPRIGHRRAEAGAEVSRNEASLPATGIESRGRLIHEASSTTSGKWFMKLHEYPAGSFELGAVRASPERREVAQAVPARHGRDPRASSSPGGRPRLEAPRPPIRGPIRHLEASRWTARPRLSVQPNRSSCRTVPSGLASTPRSRSARASSSANPWWVRTSDAPVALA